MRSVLIAVLFLLTAPTFAHASAADPAAESDGLIAVPTGNYT